MLFYVGILTLAIWFALVFMRGWFWAVERPGNFSPFTERLLPDISVVAVVPARNEADSIGDTVAGLLGQDFAGRLSVIVVDDQSDDGTADLARDAAERLGAADRLTVLTGAPLPEGWSGKMWAVSQGVAHAETMAPDFLWLTDADISHKPENLSRLATRATLEGLDLLSQMVLLRCQSIAERCLIPAFVYFFFMIYPPRWVADPDQATAAAAGGSMLVRPSSLQQIGGIERIRGALIDDCALAAAIKGEGGRIRLDVTDLAHSTRVYAGFGSIWSMIARTAFTQLDHSVLMLVGALLGLGLTFLLPVYLAFYGDDATSMCGWVDFEMMGASFAPILGLYRRSPLWAVGLPLIALFYGLATIGSAVNYGIGRGGQWKGRAQAKAAAAS